jgi:hypothetical protein
MRAVIVGEFVVVVFNAVSPARLSLLLIVLEN